MERVVIDYAARSNPGAPAAGVTDADDRTASLRAVRATPAQPAPPGQAQPTRKQRRRGKKVQGGAAAAPARSPAAGTPSAAPGARLGATTLAPAARPGAAPEVKPGVTSPAPGGQPARRGTRGGAGSSKKGLPYRTMALAGASAVMAGAAFLILTRSHNGATQAHVLTTPTSLGCFAQQPQLAEQMQAKQLQQQIVSRSSGTAKNVVYAVYECPGSGSAPQVILFIGGNLVGATPGSFISGFISNLNGAAATSAGSLGGDAACAPGVNGKPAVCAWADNDTFGAFVSADFNASGLAKQMRQMRPEIERPAGRQP